jgi:hypothetical protein
VRASRTLTVGEPIADGARAARCLVAKSIDAPPFFHAIPARTTFEEGDVVRLPQESSDLLGLKLGDSVHCLPLGST